MKVKYSFIVIDLVSSLSISGIFQTNITNCFSLNTIIGVFITDRLLFSERFSNYLIRTNKTLFLLYVQERMLPWYLLICVVPTDDLSESLLDRGR